MAIENLEESKNSNLQVNFRSSGPQKEQAREPQSLSNKRQQQRSSSNPNSRLCVTNRKWTDKRCPNRFEAESRSTPEHQVRIKQSRACLSCQEAQTKKVEIGYA